MRPDAATAPTLFAGDEMFWGNDRLEDAVAWALAAQAWSARRRSRTGGWEWCRRT